MSAETGERIAARQARRLDRDLSAILQDAAGALVAQFGSVGIVDPADMARRLNRRGFPCFGRRRWTAAAVQRVQRRLARKDAENEPGILQESACASGRSALG